MTVDLLLLKGVAPLGTRDEGDFIKVIAEAGVLPPEQCPECGHKPLYKHGKRKYQYADTAMHGKAAKIEIERQRYRCKACGKIETPAIESLDDKRIATKRLISYIESKCFSSTFSALAKETGLAINTIKAVALDYMGRLDDIYVRETPRIMGVDEVKICGSYCAVITNIEMRTTFDILQKRTKDVITPYFRKLKDKDKIEWITLDMWGPYRDVLQQEIPDARLVVDRFHVVEKASRALDSLRIKIQADLEKDDRVKMKKHLRWGLLRRNEKRTAEDDEKLAYIRTHHPKLAVSYDLAEQFHNIYELPDRDCAEKAFDDWVRAIPPEFTDSFGKFARMVNNHHQNIFNYFDLTITEAANGLMKLVNLMGGGYSFEITRGATSILRLPLKQERYTHSGNPKSITDPVAAWGNAKVTDYGRYIANFGDD